MIECGNTKCEYKHCCVECNIVKSQGGQCGCKIVAGLKASTEEILKHCQHVHSSQGEK